MKILVTGANGQVGTEVCTLARAHLYDVDALDLPELDITDADAVIRCVRQSQPDLLVNAAAYTAVDRAEEQPDTAFAVNRDGPGHLAKAAGIAGIPLIHLSTDFVFDGKTSTPYLEETPVAPLSTYGASKAEGESAIRVHLREHIILRTSWVYSAHGQNFVKTMLRLGTSRPSLRVVADQHGCPTSARDIAGTILLLIDRIRSARPVPWGIYHYCGKGSTTWHGFAGEIFSQAHDLADLSPPEVLAIPTSEYPTKAVRPLYSVLDCTKIERALGLPRPSWKQSLREVVEQLVLSSERIH